MLKAASFYIKTVSLTCCSVINTLCWWNTCIYRVILSLEAPNKFGKSIPEFGETHSSLLGCERRPVSVSIMSRSCFASFPVCVYKFSSHLNNIIFYRQYFGTSSDRITLYNASQQFMRVPLWHVFSSCQVSAIFPILYYFYNLILPYWFDNIINKYILYYKHAATALN